MRAYAIIIHYYGESITYAELYRCQRARYDERRCHGLGAPALMPAIFMQAYDLLLILRARSSSGLVRMANFMIIARAEDMSPGGMHVSLSARRVSSMSALRCASYGARPFRRAIMSSGKMMPGSLRQGRRTPNARFSMILVPLWGYYRLAPAVVGLVI